MKGWVFWVCILLAVGVPPSALGDGCVIPATAFAKMEIPDQRALICYADGKETLVIDTAFKGEGTNFAWIVPVPSKPEVEAASPGLFTTLEFVFQPVIHHDISYYFLISLFVGGCALCFLLPIKMGLPLKRALLDGFTYLIFYVFILALILSTFATAGSSGPPVGSVAVVERKQVGIFDTATLSSTDGTALVEWLNQNGFATPTNYLPVIRDYAREGWYFVASKVRLDAATNDAVKPHPLSFTFKTERAVYPLRLTGINNPHCKIELYVFGKSRAVSPKFSEERCEEPRYFAPKNEDFAHGSKPEGLTIGHPDLLRLVGGSPVATKLTADMTSADMEDDANIDWSGYHLKKPVLYSSHGAAVIGANVAAPFLVTAVLMLFLVAGTHVPWAAKVRMVGRIFLVIGVAGWLVVFVALPKVTVTVTRMPGLLTKMDNRQIVMGLEGEWQYPTNKLPDVLDVAWARKAIEEVAKEYDDTRTRLFTNRFLGQAMREEDSPGNYTLRETTNGVEYMWYDVDGAEHPVLLFQDGKGK